MDFKEIERKLKIYLATATATDIILCMVESLEHPATDRIDMGTYGRKNSSETMCFGCAATNTICRLLESTASEYISWRSSVGWTLFCNVAPVLNTFESAINNLRRGQLGYYNEWILKAGGVHAQIPNPTLTYSLPLLTSTFTKADILEYRKFAESL